MTNQGIDLSTLTEQIEKLKNVELSDTQSKEIYQVFLSFASALAPAITTHLMKNCLTPEQLRAWKSPEGLETGNGGEHLREYNSKLIARLIYDMKPAISGAFNNGDKTVDAIVRDLRFDDPPIALKSIPAKPKGAGGKHHRDLRSTARRLLYEIVVYEAARNSRGQELYFYSLNQVVERSIARKFLETPRARTKALKRRYYRSPRESEVDRARV